MDNFAESPLVSIVMATYNGQKFIRQQIESILNQSYFNLEIIIVDDGSVDDTLDIIGEYAKHDTRIKVYPTTKNLGLVRNFERGLKLAKGEFIALSDQDDIFYPNKIEVLVYELSGAPDCDLIISDLELIDEDGHVFAKSMWQFQHLRPKENKPFRYLLMDNFATGCAMMMRRRLLEIAIPFPTDFMIHDQWLAVVASNKEAGGIRVLPISLTKYRQHKTNVIGARPFNEVGLRYIIQKLGSFDGLSKYADNAIKEIVIQQRRVSALLARENIWSAKEASILQNLNATLLVFIPETNHSIIWKLIKLPSAFFYSYYSKDFFKTSFRFLFLTLFHRKSG